MPLDARDQIDAGLEDAIASASNSGEAYELSQDRGVNPSREPTLGDVVNARLGRRGMMRGMLAVTAMSTALGGLTSTLMSTTALAKTAADSQFKFKEVPHGVDEKHHVAEGYDADVLIRWGDPVVAGAPAFDQMNQTAAKQAQQFGYNCDYVGFLPFAADTPTSGMMFVNHEYTIPQLMFPGVPAPERGRTDFSKVTKEMVDIEMAAHGGSLIEVHRGPNGKWSYVKDSRYNRRLTMSTPMAFTGPAAGSDRLKTSADPTGRMVLGMINNCAGGMTPWGTFLSGEENFHGYFQGKLAEGHREAVNHRRYGAPDGWYNWGQYHDRMDVSKEPNEPNRFGWIVEIDPFDPTSTPIKRTALGRMKHEGGETVVNADGRVVVYMGDDERFEYAYKYVSNGRFDPSNRAANRALLDDGVLYVAKFNDDGTGQWLALVHGQGPLTAANGFNSQGDVLIEARRAADLVGATPMDRPEDFEPNKLTGKVYLALTNNERRKADDANTARRPNKVNPRVENLWGQVIELSHAGNDHAATAFRWEMLVVAGNPADAKVTGVYHTATSKDGWFACPDNMAIDHAGRLWVGTDQGSGWARASGTADGIYAMETEGELRGYSRQFFRAPIGAEICGMLFMPDGRSMTVAVQHPAADGSRNFKGFERASTFADPATRWPDFQPNMPPRPSVVVVTKRDGGVIGS
jgi:hypothetical protein